MVDYHLLVQISQLIFQVLWSYVSYSGTKKRDTILEEKLKDIVKNVAKDPESLPASQERLNEIKKEAESYAIKEEKLVSALQGALQACVVALLFLPHEERERVVESISNEELKMGLRASLPIFRQFDNLKEKVDKQIRPSDILVQEIKKNEESI